MTVPRAGDRREQERREQDRQLQRLERAVLMTAVGWRMNPEEHTDQLWDAAGLYVQALGIDLPKEAP